MSYTLKLRNPPKRDALEPVGGASIGTGFIIAFQDVGDDGTFNEAVDPVIALAEQFCIRFIQGEFRSDHNNPKKAAARDAEVYKLPQGFSILDLREEHSPTFKPVSSTTPIDLMVSEHSLKMLRLIQEKALNEP